MKQFDFYEFAGLLAPGAVTLLGLAFLFEWVEFLSSQKEITVGDFGLFVVLSYVFGHLTQALGGLLERLWWKLWGGMPTEWARTGKPRLLGNTQVESLRNQIETQLHLPIEKKLSQVARQSWLGITRQIYAAVEAAGRSKRVDIFNGNYGLSRGLAASFLLLFLLCLVKYKLTLWQNTLLLLAGAALALYRMHRFGRHYATELFVQFLQLAGSGGLPKGTHNER